jgi:hypothetical protein
VQWKSDLKQAESKQRVLCFSKVFSDTIDEKENFAPRNLMVYDTIVSTSESFKYPLPIPMVFAKKSESYAENDHLR